MSWNRAPLHHPAPTLAEDGDPVVLAPTDAGWEYCGLRIVRLAPGRSRTFATRSAEHLVLPLSGGVSVEVDRTFAGAEGGGRVELDLAVGVGHVEVRRG